MFVVFSQLIFKIILVYWESMVCSILTNGVGVGGGGGRVEGGRVEGEGGGSFGHRITRKYIPPYTLSVLISDKSPNFCVAVIHHVMAILIFYKLPVTVQVHYDN